MQGLYQIFINVSWPMLFLLAWIVLLIVFIYQDSQKTKNLLADLEKKQNDPQACLVLVNQYLKHNPLSQANSTLRLLILPILITAGKKDETLIHIKKIRAIDLHSNTSESLMLSLFLLKEYNYTLEYNLLSAKTQKNSQLFHSVIRDLLSQAPTDMENLNVNEFETSYAKAIIAYYLGTYHLQKDDSLRAKEDFKISEQYFPPIRELLKMKGYAE